MKILTAVAWHVCGAVCTRSWIEGQGYQPDNREKRVLDGPVRGTHARIEALKDAMFELWDRHALEASGVYLTESTPPRVSVPAVAADAVDHLGGLSDGELSVLQGLDHYADEDERRAS